MPKKKKTLSYPIKASIAGISYSSPNSFSTVPLIKNLRGSRKAVRAASEGLKRIAKSRAGISAARPTGKVPSWNMGKGWSAAAKGVGVKAAATSFAGLAAVAGAGAIGAAVIYGASKKTKRTQEKNIRATMKQADAQIAQIRKNRRKKKK